MIVLKALIWLSLFSGFQTCEDTITKEENCKHCYPYDNLISYDRELAKLCWDLCEIEEIDDWKDICD